MVERLAIVGTGLIGASLGLAARARGIAVSGWDPDPAALSVAAGRGALDAADSLEAALEGASLAVVAAPVSSLREQVAAVLAATGEGTTVTDVGSTKASVVAAAAGSPRFVGGHPICGSEAHGAEHASAAIFEGATWFLTPIEGTDPDRHRLVHRFVADLGAVPHAIDPTAHDRLVALTSHLPHVLANVVVNRAGASLVEGHDPLASAGGSLRDMTRIAGANPRMWIDIFLDNAEAVRAEIADLRTGLDRVDRALAEGDTEYLASWIGEAATNRRRMLKGAYADPGALHRVVMHVPDEPGVLAAIHQALGAGRINIQDFELEHISEERGGTVTLFVTGESEALRAAGLLERLGYGVLVTGALDES